MHTCLWDLANELTSNVLCCTVKELDEFWAYQDLLGSFVKKLSYCCTMELIPLMEIPGIKLVCQHCSFCMCQCCFVILLLHRQGSPRNYEKGSASDELIYVWPMGVR